MSDAVSNYRMLFQAQLLTVLFNLFFFSFSFSISSRDMNLDTKLELIRTRESLEYSFKTLPDFKDCKYKGQWKNSKPSGRYLVFYRG